MTPTIGNNRIETGQFLTEADRENIRTWLSYGTEYDPIGSETLDLLKRLLDTNPPKQVGEQDDQPFYRDGEGWPTGFAALPTQPTTGQNKD